jgi:hypothetical protein
MDALLANTVFTQIAFARIVVLGLWRRRMMMMMRRKAPVGVFISI